MQTASTKRMKNAPHHSLKTRFAAMLRQARATRGDMLWLRWGALCAIVLAATLALMACGSFAPLDEKQLQLLLGRPFFLEATAAQVTLLSQAETFWLCIPVTLYLALALLLQRRFYARTQIAFMAMAAAALPGLLCVLWDGVLYVSPILFNILATWLLTVAVPFFRRARS